MSSPLFSIIVPVYNCGKYIAKCLYSLKYQEYITFCDCDDFISPHMISTLTRAMEISGQPDFLIWRFSYEVPTSIDSLKKYIYNLLGKHSRK